MKPTPEQVAAAKAYPNETEAQWDILQSYSKAHVETNSRAILLAALEAAEADSARLDWLLDTKHGNAEVLIWQGKFSRTPDTREHIDAARKDQP